MFKYVSLDTILQKNEVMPQQTDNYKNKFYSLKKSVFLIPHSQLISKKIYIRT